MTSTPYTYAILMMMGLPENAIEPNSVQATPM
jgi:hypothetical protein